MNIDNFYEKYHPLPNHFYTNPEDCPWDGCMLETYDREIEYVLSFANNPALQRNLWTIVEGDDGQVCICAGYHLVNRMGYLITDEPWGDEGECYVDDGDWELGDSEFIGEE